jgi:hypothetical protein
MDGMTTPLERLELQVHILADAAHMKHVFVK